MRLKEKLTRVGHSNINNKWECVVVITYATIPSTPGCGDGTEAMEPSTRCVLKYKNIEIVLHVCSDIGFGHIIHDMWNPVCHLLQDKVFGCAKYLACHMINCKGVYAAKSPCGRNLVGERGWWQRICLCFPSVRRIFK